VVAGYSGDSRLTSRMSHFFSAFVVSLGLLQYLGLFDYSRVFTVHRHWELLLLLFFKIDVKCCFVAYIIRLIRIAKVIEYLKL
jgi:hypothetical protein